MFVRSILRGLTLMLLALMMWLTPALAHAQQDAAPDRSTPRRALAAFLEAAEREDFVRAASLLDLRTVPAAKRKSEGPLLAEHLAAVMHRSLYLDLTDISDDPQGSKEDGDKLELIGAIALEGSEVPITLTASNTKPAQWSVSSATVMRIPALYARYGPTWIEERLPERVLEPRLGSLALWQWAGGLIALVLAFGLGDLVSRGTHVALRRFGQRGTRQWDTMMVNSLRRPVRAFVAMGLFRLLVDGLGVPAVPMAQLSIALKIGFIVVVAWAATVLVDGIANGIETRARDASPGGVDLKARGLRTQVSVLRRVFTIGIAVLAGALVLVQFEIVRNVGMSLLASAGVAGVVLGLAAQKTIGSLLAGLQLSITQPMRLGDEVFIEGEWGVIEEITLTYVVVRIWDERRLIVPMPHFLDKPFANWTKVSGDLHGTVMLYVDACLPVDALRTRLDELLVGEQRWDGRTKNVQVTDSNDRAKEVRVLVSARSAGELFGLRTYLRENLLAWVAAQDDGRYLPRTRLEVPRGAEPTR